MKQEPQYVNIPSSSAYKISYFGHIPVGNIRVACGLTIKQTWKVSYQRDIPINNVSFRKGKFEIYEFWRLDHRVI